MGTYQFITIFLALVIIITGIIGAVAVIRQQGIEHEKKVLDDFLFQASCIVYEQYLMPPSYGGYGKSVLYMTEDEDKVIALLPEFNETMQGILSTENGFTNKGFKIKMWHNYWQKFALGVCSKTYDFQRWILVHCSTGQMEIKNDEPVSTNFTSQ